MMSENEILKELPNFIGTERYYKSSIFGGLNLTEGIEYLRNAADCFWLIDVVESYQTGLKHVPFQIWRIRVNQDKTAIVDCREDTNSPILVKQEFTYTDFPMKEFEFYCIEGVVLLKSEY